MRPLLPAILLLLCLPLEAKATPWREAARSLLDAAPDQETLHDYLAPATTGDADERREADAGRLARIAELKKEYESSRSAIARAGALYELSGLYQERTYDLRDQAVERYTAALDRWWIGEALATPPQLKLDAVREELLKRVNVLRDMVANFQEDPRRDEVTWQIANTMARLGNDHCEFYFKQIIGPAKTDDWAVKARLSWADYLVSAKRLDEATAVYGEVREKAPDELKAYATYRLGWVYLTKGLAATGKPREALLRKAEAALKLVVVSVKEDKETRYRLRAEAGRDLAWLWAVLGDEKEPPAFFARQEMEDLIPVFRDKLAQQWLSQGLLAKGAAYYHGLIAANPTDPRVPDMRLRLCQAYIAAGDMQGLTPEAAALEQLTTKKDDPWLMEHEDDNQLIARARKMSTMLPLTAGLQLSKAAETEKSSQRKKALLAAAATELDAYTRKAPNDPQIATIRATLASALIGAERYPDALAQLDEIVKLGRRSDAYLANAAYERLNILVKLDGEQKYPPVPELAAVKSPLPLPELKRRFAVAAGDYLRIVPKAEIEPNLRYQIAMDLFVYGHYDEALPQFETLVNDYPRSDQARSAIETMLSYHLKHDHWDELVRLSTNLLNNRSVKGKDLRHYIQQNLDYAKEQQKHR